MIYHDKYHEKSFWDLRSSNLIIKNLPSRVIFNLLFSDGFIYMTNPGTQGTNRSQIWWANNHGNSLSQRWSSTLSDNEEGYFCPYYGPHRSLVNNRYLNQLSNKFYRSHCY